MKLNMKESPELNELNSRILEIISDCKSEEGVSKLQSIYDDLNGNKSLQVTGFREKVKNLLNNLSSKYKKQMIQERIELAKGEILDAIKKYIFTTDIMKKSNSIIKDMPSDLALSINNVLDLGLGLEFSDKTVKRYPIILSQDIKEKGYNKAINVMSKNYLDNSITQEQIIQRYKEQCRQKVSDIEDKSRGYEIEPYYGTKEFMESRIQYIKECMDKMLNAEKFKCREDINNYISRTREILSEYENTSLSGKSIEEQKNVYKKLETLYKEVIDIEERLSPEVARVWKEKMSSVEQYSKDRDFAFLARTITNGEEDIKDVKKISTQYITSKTLTLKGDYGVLYAPNIDNIVAISSEDVQNWKISKEDFINSRFFKRIPIYKTYR